MTATTVTKTKAKMKKTTPGADVAAGAGPWAGRVEAADWDTVAAELDEFGGALLPQLLTPVHRPGWPPLPLGYRGRPQWLPPLEDLRPVGLPFGAAGHRRRRLRGLTVFFADEADAAAAEYRPYAVCCPGPYQQWKTVYEEGVPWTR